MNTVNKRWKLVPALLVVGVLEACGAAVARKSSVLVEDVHAFPGHIACDSASNSELVVPLLRDGAVLGVIDLDSPRTGRFDEADRAGIEEVARLFVAACDW